MIVLVNEKIKGKKKLSKDLEIIEADLKEDQIIDKNWRENRKILLVPNTIAPSQHYSIGVRTI